MLGMALAVLLVITISNPAQAEFRPRVDVDLSSGTVIINGKPAVRFQTSNGNLTPSDRASITADRIKQLVATGFDPFSIGTKGDETQGRIYSGDTMICIATSLDGKVNSTNPLLLAGLWAQQIKKLLLMPPIVLSDNSVIVPLGENRRVDIGGAATGPIVASSDNNDAATVLTGTDGRYVTISGKSVGKAVVALYVDGENAFITVSVKKYAGRVPGTPTAEVTGNPCPSTLVAYVARQTLTQNVILEPGASLKIKKLNCSKSGLDAGRSCSVNADIEISGEGYIDNNTPATIEVKNIQMEPESVDQLFYSNNPERILKYQTLYAGKLETDKPTRILYHHQNMMGKRVHFIVEIINPNPTPAKLRVFGATSDPSIDTVVVGYQAGVGFVKDQMGNISVIESVPPESRLVLVSDFLKHEQTISGILQMRQLEGMPVYVRVTAAEPGVDNVSKGTIASAPKMLMLQMSDHIYTSPVKTLNANYMVGQRWAFVPIGKHALQDTTSQKTLYGNYGVTYDINIKVENPTDQIKKVNVVFEATAGLSSGVFIIDGKFVAVKYVQSLKEVTLASYSLDPGEVRNIKVITIPLGGSSYPANLVVRT